LANPIKNFECDGLPVLEFLVAVKTDGAWHPIQLRGSGFDLKFLGGRPADDAQNISVGFIQGRGHLLSFRWWLLGGVG